MISRRTSLGIDISDNFISVVLLRDGKKGPELVKAARQALPEGAIVDGNIADPSLLAKTIKELLAKNKIHKKSAAVSLTANPVLTQIIDVPSEMPKDMKKFILGEIKYSSALSGKKINCDFCGIEGNASAEKRLFLTAVDEEKITNLLKTLRLAGIEAVSIEPTVAVYARALYARKIENKYDSNVLLAILREYDITVCVFRKESLDFVRSIDIGVHDLKSEQGLTKFTEEVNAIIQYYELDVCEESEQDKWELLAAVDCREISASELEQKLKSKFGHSFTVRSADNLCDDTPVELTKKAKNNSSLGAVGLALKSITKSYKLALDIDLLPLEIKQARVTRKLILIISNIAAAVLIAMIVLSGLVNSRVGQVKAAYPKQQGQSPTDIRELLSEHKGIEQDCKKLSAKLEALKKVSFSEKQNNWPEILDAVRLSIPRKVCITRLACQNESNLSIEGKSLSYRDVHSFVETLNSSKHFESASLTRTSKEGKNANVVVYSINCLLANSEGS